MDLAYANGAFIAGAESFPPRWAEQAAAFRAACGVGGGLEEGRAYGAGLEEGRAYGGGLEEGRAYGPGAREKFDLFQPARPARGLLVFVHGGYWKAFGRSDWSHLAAGALARGWACAIPSYTLAPEARITAMVAQVAAAVTAAAALVPGPVVVAGHSAGGHLAARMACADGPLGARLRRVVPISPLAELAPLLATTMIADLRLDADEVARQSPARLLRRAGVDAHVWVGGQERPAFLWQARTLSEAWGCGWTVAPGRHHFDVIDGLADPESPLLTACLGDG